MRASARTCLKASLNSGPPSSTAQTRPLEIGLLGLDSPGRAWDPADEISQQSSDLHGAKPSDTHRERTCCAVGGAQRGRQTGAQEGHGGRENTEAEEILYHHTTQGSLNPTTATAVHAFFCCSICCRGVGDHH